MGLEEETIKDPRIADDCFAHLFQHALPSTGSDKLGGQCMSK